MGDEYLAVDSGGNGFSERDWDVVVGQIYVFVAIVPCVLLTLLCCMCFGLILIVFPTSDGHQSGQ